MPLRCPNRAVQFNWLCMSAISAHGTVSRDCVAKVSDVSAHGTVLRDCVVECLRLIFTPIGVEDDEETRDDEGACRAGR